MKKSVKKLTLSKETLSLLQLEQVGGGSYFDIRSYTDGLPFDMCFCPNVVNGG